MLLQRLCRISDLDAIERLAAGSPVSLTSLPADRKRLSEMIEASESAMAAEVGMSGEERYLFVTEDSDTGELVGCSGMVAAAGFSEPFYALRNEMSVHVSRELGLHNRIHALSLCHDLTGHSLLFGCWLDAACNDAAAFELNARGRLLFIAAHPQRFADTLAAELPGVSDAEGNSPFWDALGRHFFAVSYSEAERIGSQRGRSLLGELMPGYPVYVPMLPEAAQEVIGQPHPAVAELFDCLIGEGFEGDNYVDLFDAGPLLQGRTASLASTARGQLAQVRLGQGACGSRRWLVANQQVADFRAASLWLDWQPGEPLQLDARQADLLKVADGDTLRLVPEV